MLDISFVSKPFRAAATSSMRRFSEVRLPFEMMSNKHFESVSKSNSKGVPVRSRSSERSVNAESNKSENAITSAAIAERQSRLALYDLNIKGKMLLVPSVSRMM